MPVCQAIDETVTNGFNVCIYKGELAEKNIDSIVVEAAGVGYLITYRRSILICCLTRERM